MLKDILGKENCLRICLKRARLATDSSSIGDHVDGGLDCCRHNVSLVNCACRVDGNNERKSQLNVVPIGRPCTVLCVSTSGAAQVSWVKVEGHRAQPWQARSLESPTLTASHAVENRRSCHTSVHSLLGESPSRPVSAAHHCRLVVFVHGHLVADLEPSAQKESCFH